MLLHDFPLTYMQGQFVDQGREALVFGGEEPFFSFHELASVICETNVHMNVSEDNGSSECGTE